MSKEWIDDQTTLSSVAPEILEQEERIAQQRQLISQLNASGNRDLANEARQFLGNMCDSLAKIRREERGTKITCVSKLRPHFARGGDRARHVRVSAVTTSARLAHMSEKRSGAISKRERRCVVPLSSIRRSGGMS